MSNSKQHSNTGSSGKRTSKLKRYLKGLFWLVVALLGVVAAVYFVEERRGLAAWSEFVSEWEAKGERFDLGAYVPEEIPAEENLAATPLFAELFEISEAHPDWFSPYSVTRPSDPSALGRLALISTAIGRYHRDSSDRWLNPDLPTGWRGARARQLNAITVFQEEGSPAIPEKEAAAKLRAVVDHSCASDWSALMEDTKGKQFVPPIDWGKPSEQWMTSFAYFQTMSAHISLRCAALLTLETNAPELAFEEWEFGMRLADFPKNYGLAGHVLYRNGVAIQLTPLWEGAMRHQWTGLQLLRAQETLAELADGLGSNLLRCIRFERNLTLHVLLDDHQRAETFSRMPNSEGRTGAFLRFPKGWVFQNALTICRPLQNYFLSKADGSLEREVLNMDRAVDWYNELGGIASARLHPYHVLAVNGLISPEYPERALAFEQELRVFVTGLACERYYLREGKFPESLDALAPDYLDAIPLDSVTGKPLHYRQHPDGSPVIWAIGSNRIDNGGLPHSDAESGDVVWQYRLSDALMKREEELEAEGRKP
jgi:hypothetical protein